MQLKAPGENERSMYLNFHLTSYVVSEYRQEPEKRSIMIFTALMTGRTVIFRKGELSFPFMASHLCEMLDLAGGDHRVESVQTLTGTEVWVIVVVARDVRN